MYELSVGSKVFLLGEYQVLQQGGALLVTLEPRFKMTVRSGNGAVSGISPGSPADQFLRRQKDFFQAWDLDFQDPHQGRGGFGASTAQVALVQGLYEGHADFKSSAQFNFDLKKLHKSYLEVAWNGQGVPPSGADLLSQFQGGLVEVNFERSQIQRQSWPFSKWQVLFFATGRKLATHEHLNALEAMDLSGLRQCYDRAMMSFRRADGEGFARSFNDYRLELHRQGWEYSETTSLIQKISPFSGVHGVKGCGAMGVDVLAVLIESEREIELVSQCENLGLTYIGNLDHRTEGFDWKWIQPLEVPCQ